MLMFGCGIQFHQILLTTTTSRCLLYGLLVVYKGHLALDFWTYIIRKDLKTLNAMLDMEGLEYRNGVCYHGESVVDPTNRLRQAKFKIE